MPPPTARIVSHGEKMLSRLQSVEVRDVLGGRLIARTGGGGGQRRRGARLWFGQGPACHNDDAGGRWHATLGKAPLCRGTQPAEGNLHTSDPSRAWKTSPMAIGQRCDAMQRGVAQQHLAPQFDYRKIENRKLECIRGQHAAGSASRA